jgi:hypothetical protein
MGLRRTWANEDALSVGFFDLLASDAFFLRMAGNEKNHQVAFIVKIITECGQCPRFENNLS